MKSGRKSKPPSQRAIYHIGAGVTRGELATVRTLIRTTGKTQSTIIREAFGLSPGQDKSDAKARQ